MQHSTFSLPGGSQFSRCDSQSFYGRIFGKSNYQRVRVSLSGQVIECIDLPKKSRFAATPQAVSDQTPDDLEHHWVYASQQVIGLRTDGASAKRIELSNLPLAIDEYHEVGDMLVTKDSLYLTICSSRSNNQKQPCDHDLTATVAKLSLDGELIWTVAIPVEMVEHKEVAHVNEKRKTKKRPAWTPTTWQAFGHDCLVISGNRILARLADSSSGLGRCYLIDSDNGKLVWRSDSSAGGFTTPANRGSFLVGDQGYHWFETNLIEADGSCGNHWDSHGHSFLCDSRCYSIQMANMIPNSQRCVEMIEDGTVVDASEPLGAYYTSRPQKLADGCVYFWRNDKVWRWELQTGVEPVIETNFGEGASGRSIKFSDTCVGFCIFRLTEPRLNELVVVDI